MRSGFSDPAIVMRRPRSRPASRSERIGCADSATTMPAAAIAASVTRQPSSKAIVGSNAPPSAAPAGTPVCLIENVSAMRSGGAVRARIWDEAGVIGPYPAPMTSGARISSATPAFVHAATGTSSNPAAHSSTATCEMRIAP